MNITLNHVFIDQNEAEERRKKKEMVISLNEHANVTVVYRMAEKKSHQSSLSRTKTNLRIEKKIIVEVNTLLISSFQMEMESRLFVIFFTGSKNNTWKLRLENVQKERREIIVNDIYLIIDTITVILSFET